ncbi:MAG TPA: T9SS type A sorting domain-containing protein, partial [Bacteroidia bacterium]|nr:T9SS type A sorting domain-containing protein [Bacteroidia bacterium]
AYFATVDANWNSAYPYAVGPTFYGVKTAAKVTSITESVTTYTPPAVSLQSNTLSESNVGVFPNPANDIIAVQVGNLNKEDVQVQLYDINGKLIKESIIYQGTTIAYFDVQTLYDGIYIVKVIKGSEVVNRKVVIRK